MAEASEKVSHSQCSVPPSCTSARSPFSLPGSWRVALSAKKSTFTFLWQKSSPSAWFALAMLPKASTLLVPHSYFPPLQIPPQYSAISPRLYSLWKSQTTFWGMYRVLHLPYRCTVKLLHSNGLFPRRLCFTQFSQQSSGAGSPDSQYAFVPCKMLLMEKQTWACSQDTRNQMYNTDIVPPLQGKGLPAS